MALLLRSQTLRAHHGHSAVSGLQAFEARRHLAPLAVAAGSSVGTSVALDQLKAGKPKTVGSFVAIGLGGLAVSHGKGQLVRAAGVGAVTGALWSLFRKGGEGRSIVFPFG